MFIISVVSLWINLKIIFLSTGYIPFSGDNRLVTRNGPREIHGDPVWAMPPVDKYAGYPQVFQVVMVRKI